jgi:hypothetical protein
LVFLSRIHCVFKVFTDANWRGISDYVFRTACVALGFVVLAYAMGFPNVGGVLTLSTLYVALWSLLKSGAFSTSWLQGQSLFSIGNAARLEFAKTMICAGIGVDGLAAMMVGYRSLGGAGLADIVLLTWIIVWAAAVCAFLARWLAAYLTARSAR